MDNKHNNVPTLIGPFAIKMTRFDTYGGSVERIANVFPGVPDFLDAVVTWPKTASSPARTYFFKVCQYHMSYDVIYYI